MEIPALLAVPLNKVQTIEERMKAKHASNPGILERFKNHIEEVADEVRRLIESLTPDQKLAVQTNASRLREQITKLEQDLEDKRYLLRLLRTLCTHEGEDTCIHCGYESNNEYF